MSRALSALASLAIAGTLAACGDDGDDLIEGDALRECLAGTGLGANPRDEVATPPVYLSTAPDFSAFVDRGPRLDVVVQGNEQKAKRIAADVRSAMLPLGIADVDDRVISERNVVAVFADSPSQPEREAVFACLE